MPRIRTIKPEFWDSPDTIRASMRARLLYIAMWNWADDYGIGDGNLGRLINFAFPGDNIPASDFPRLVAEVSDCFGVIVYQHAGRPYYYVPTWEKHQRTEKKAKQHVPFPDVAQTAPDPHQHAEVDPTTGSVGDSAASVGNTAPGTGEQGNKGKKELGNPSPDGEGRAKPRATGTRIPDPFVVNTDMRQWAAEEAPAVDVDRATRMFVDHFRAASGRNATKRDWLAAWRNWLRRDQQNQPRNGIRAVTGRESSLDRRDRQRDDMFAQLALIDAEKAAIGQ